jgi:hypothetical protein
LVIVAIWAGLAVFFYQRLTLGISGGAQRRPLHAVDTH